MEEADNKGSRVAANNAAVEDSGQYTSENFNATGASQMLVHETAVANNDLSRQLVKQGGEEFVAAAVHDDGKSPEAPLTEVAARQPEAKYEGAVLMQAAPL